MMSYTVIGGGGPTLGALYSRVMGHCGMRSHMICKRLMGGWVAGWLSSSAERTTDWPGPKYRIGENVGRERSKMRSPRGDSPFRYGWIWRRGEEMEG